MQLPDGWYLYLDTDDPEPLRDSHGWFGPRSIPWGAIHPYHTHAAAEVIFGPVVRVVTAIEATAILAMAAARLEMEGA